MDIIGFKKVFCIGLVSLLLFVACEKDTSDSVVPSVETAVAISITSNSIVCGGIISSTGGAKILSKGVCWGASENPTTDGSVLVVDDDNKTYVAEITGLDAGATYHVRAFAINSVGVAYGSDISFTTNLNLPTVATQTVFSITSSSAEVSGSIISDAGGTVTASGFCWGASVTPTIDGCKTIDGSLTGTFTSTISGIEPNTKYYVRAYATNPAGTVYGSAVSFTTLLSPNIGIDNSNMMLGNPSQASEYIVAADNYLMVKKQYALSYNSSKRTMNWTSWHLYAGDVGSTGRQDDFRADATLPSSWYHVTETDYQYSTYGFDRGHMCPSADRTLSVPDNSTTFLMTNMIPQAPNNNQQTWANLENYCRSLVGSGNELYIISGPYGQGGTSAKGTFSVLASGVTVPSKTWKIIVVLPNGNNDLSRINANTRVIAVVMPNTQACSSYSWTYYRVSVDSIETLTGYDFLSNVSTDIQNTLEIKVDNL